MRVGSGFHARARNANPGQNEIRGDGNVGSGSVIRQHVVIPAQASIPEYSMLEDDARLPRALLTLRDT